MSILQNIFSDHFHKLLNSNIKIRDTVIENVDKMIHCGDFKRGYAFYICEHCSRFMVSPFRCRSRFCTSCGNLYKHCPMIMLLLYSGMRRGELCGLEWSDIDLKHGIINISKSSLYISQIGIFDDTTKNRTSERVIRIPEDMTTLLKEYRRSQNQLQLTMGDLWQGTQKVFTTQNGKPIHPDSITGWFKSFIKRNDLPDIHLHSLRHTNATLLIAAGTDIRTVAKRLGHATASTTTNIYAHAIKSADEMAAEKLADILNPMKRNAN